MAKVNLDNTEYGMDSKGNVYVIDVVKKTCKKVCSTPATFGEVDDIDVPALGLDAYRNYLRDKFMDETCTLKNGKLNFRGYRISLTIEDGFVIEDTQNHYEIVDTDFEGIPTPEELGKWFEAPKRKELTEEEKAQEYADAVEEGKKRERAKKEEREQKKVSEDEEEDIDFEELREKVLDEIKGLRDKTSDFDVEDFKDFIPFKRWRRKANALLKQLRNKEIRRPKFLNELERITTEETFEVEEKKHRSTFKGTCLPNHSKVGYLKGNKIEVDGKLVDAVPFLVEYLLHFEPRCMAQLMKWAEGEITDEELLANPMEQDWKVEYYSKAFKNTAHNAQIITMVYDIVDIMAPQDLLFETDLKVGDVILLMIDGELKRRTVAKVEQGVEVGKGVGLLKTDRFVLAPKNNK